MIEGVDFYEKVKAGQKIDFEDLQKKSVLIASSESPAEEITILPSLGSPQLSVDLRKAIYA